MDERRALQSVRRVLPVTRRSLAPVVVLVGLGAIVVTVGAVGHVGAHGNHATAGAQVSADGTVVVDQAVIAESGHLVLHADDGGTPGRVIGHRPLDRGVHDGVEVRIEPEYWGTVDHNATVWAVLHADDGDGRFQPGRDAMLTWFREPAGDRFPVRKGTAPAVVVTDGPGTLAGGGVPVRRASLATDGFLVLHETDDGALGSVVGYRAFDAGTHRAVTVPFRGTPPSGRLTLSVTVYADDGDGTFDEGDRPVRAGDQPVASEYVLRPGATTTDGAEIITPSPSPTPAGGSVTPAATTATGTADGAGTATPGTAASSTGSATTSTDGPGFGAVPAVVGLALVITAVAVLARRD